MDCIVDFQKRQGLSGQSLPLGFTFSFPCKQLGLDQVRELSSRSASRGLRSLVPLRVGRKSRRSVSKGGAAALLNWTVRSPAFPPKAAVPVFGEEAFENGTGLAWC